MSKSAEAFRTISEVATLLETPAHVLRFWESKFSQIKPLKRAGGRRYYRPEDIALISGIKFVLHEQGMTIKGAQKLLRDKGVGHIVGLTAPITTADDAAPQTAAPPASDVDQFDLPAGANATATGIAAHAAQPPLPQTSATDVKMPPATQPLPRENPLSTRPAPLQGAGQVGLDQPAATAPDPKHAAQHPASENPAATPDVAMPDPVAPLAQTPLPEPTLPASLLNKAAPAMPPDVALKDPSPAAKPHDHSIGALLVTADAKLLHRNAPALAPLVQRMIELRKQLKQG